MNIEQNRPSESVKEEGREKELTSTVLANSEQLKAIEHQGGVLLSAGAGSGKTFVLIEHIAYLIEASLNQMRGESKEKKIQILKKKMSGLVLMTFTNKAAAELSIRLQKKAEIWAKKWGLGDSLFEAINSLQVSTIHSFCYRLVKQGFIQDLSPRARLISQEETLQKLEDLFQGWLEKRKDEIPMDLKHIFYQNERSLLKALTKIMQNPEVRALWLKKKESAQEEDSFHVFWPRILQNLNLNDFFFGLDQTRESLEGLDKKKYGDKKWYSFVLATCQLLKGEVFQSENLQSWMDHFFSDYKGVRKPKESSELHFLRSFFQDIDKLKKFLKKCGDDLVFYDQSKGDLQQWTHWIEDALFFFEQNYLTDQNISFSDLEYYTLKSLEESQETREILKKSYHYFIVDEFQDTSHVQFEILRLIAQGDFQKFFFVGDPKQAIYGFRGGELQVFFKSSKLIEKNLKLLKNYRSRREVVSFNNAFFKKLLPLGQGYKGIDPHCIPFEDQDLPPTNQNDPGEICLLTTQDELFSKDEKMTAQETQRKEALLIAQFILQRRRERPGEKICILYRSLAPARELVSTLMGLSVGFSAQMKSSFEEDPVLGLFYTFISLSLEKKRPSEELALFLFEHYFKVLNLQSDEDKLRQWTRDSISNISHYGPYPAFILFLQAQGLSCSLYEGGLEKVEGICRRFFEPEKIERALSKLFQDKGGSRLFFQWGEDSELVQVMSAHSSKGLEFDHVILGGIFTNERVMPHKEIFGSRPKSLRWKKSKSASQWIQTPQMICEGLEIQVREFSECKRLLYVACTRAIKSLSWVQWPETWKAPFTYPHSWVHPLQEFGQESKDVRQILLPLSSPKDEEQGFDLRKRPLFHLDQGGVCQRPGGSLENKPLLLSGPSVTQLVQLLICPKKFYFSSICAIQEEELSLLDLNHRQDSDEGAHSPSQSQRIPLEQRISNSGQRGTHLHNLISHALHERTWEHLGENQEEINLVHQVMNTLRPKIQGKLWESERSLHFSLMGLEVLGSLDLVVMPSFGEENCQIWDFKTGRKREGKEEEAYWAQMICYAYGLSQEFASLQQTQFSLTLFYIDEGLCLTREVNQDKIQSTMNQLANGLKNYHQVDTSSCSHCSYYNICPKESDSF